MEWKKLTSCDENKNWLATRAARNLTLLPKQNLAKTTKTLTHTHHNEDWSTKDKGSKNKPAFHWVCARETKKTKPTKLYTELQKGGVNTSSQKLLVSKKATKKKKERNMQTWRIRIHFSLQSEIFKVSLWWPFKKMLRNWKTENRHIPNLENDDNLSNCITNKLLQPWMCICPSYLALIKNESKDHNPLPLICIHTHKPLLWQFSFTLSADFGCALELD